MRNLFIVLPLMVLAFSAAILHLPLASASNSVDNQGPSICSPCSRTFLSDSYSTSDDSSSFNCDDVPSISNVNLELHRSLEGEGSHRRLISKLKFENNLAPLSGSTDEFDCKLVIIENLHEVFADPFELQRLVRRKVYLDAAVFGDTNLELPSALSNTSLVEIHIDLAHALNAHQELIIELPLHARYPPLDGSGYRTVEISKPQLYTRCMKNEPNLCHWRSPVVDVGPTKIVKWLIPCGDEDYSGFVSSFTFIFALVCALSIVFASVFYNPHAPVKYH